MLADAVVQKEYERINEITEEMKKKNLFKAGGNKKWKKAQLLLMRH